MIEKKRYEHAWIAQAGKREARPEADVRRRICSRCSLDRSTRPLRSKVREVLRRASSAPVVRNTKLRFQHRGSGLITYSRERQSDANTRLAGRGHQRPANRLAYDPDWHQRCYVEELWGVSRITRLDRSYDRRRCVEPLFIRERQAHARGENVRQNVSRRTAQRLEQRRSVDNKPRGDGRHIPCTDDAEDVEFRDPETIAQDLQSASTPDRQGLE
jgi:hypothetical protein